MTDKLKEILRLAVVLTGVSLIAGLLLAYVNEITLAPRAYQDRLKKLSALEMVLPPHDNAPDKDVIVAAGREYYLSRQKGAINGIAFFCATEKGYSGHIGLIVGADPQGRVLGVAVMEHKETPGLGSKIEAPQFLVQYTGRDLRARWAVKKDGGDFDQISGATISPRAVTEAIRAGLVGFAAHRETVLGGGK